MWEESIEEKWRVRVALSGSSSSFRALSDPIPSKNIRELPTPPPLCRLDGHLTAVSFNPYRRTWTHCVVTPKTGRLAPLEIERLFHPHTLQWKSYIRHPETGTFVPLEFQTSRKVPYQRTARTISVLSAKHLAARSFATLPAQEGTLPPKAKALVPLRIPPRAPPSKVPEAEGTGGKLSAAVADLLSVATSGEDPKGQ